MSIKTVPAARVATTPRPAQMVYLARPIDLGQANPFLVDYAIGELQALNLTSYDPLSAFNVGGDPSSVISRVNQGAMETATGAVAFLPSGVPSVGVPAEISYLLTAGIPTVIVTNLSAKSWVVAGWATNTSACVVELTEVGVSAGIDWLAEQMANAAAGRKVGEVVFEKVHPAAILPTKGYDLDAGYDLYAVEAVTIPARGSGMVACGVAIDIPEGMYAQIKGRSSTLSRHKLLVAPSVGVIDEQYTGPLFAPIVSINDEDVKIEAGQRIAQVVLLHAPGQQYAPVWGTCRNKARGSAGFGSTGL
jgi:dUTP pyrophosphatase